MLTSFCGLLTLQVGAAILSAVFFTLAAVILAANIFDYHNDYDGWPISLILMLIFVIGLIVAAIFMFASSYLESRKFALISVVIIAILLCYWIILCCFSFVSNPEHVSAVCIDTRCPESFWLANLGYRRRSHSGHRDNDHDHSNDRDRDHDHPEHTKAPEKDTTVHPKKKRVAEEDSKMSENFWKSNGQGNLFDKTHNFSKLMTKEYNKNFKIDYNIADNRTKGQTTNKTEELLAEHLDSKANTLLVQKKLINQTMDSKHKHFYFLAGDDGSRYNFGFPFIGAIFLFVINLIFLIFAAMVMWSWAQELDWADYYIEDEPVIIYEDVYD